VASDHGIALFENDSFVVKRKFDSILPSFSAFSLAFDGENRLYIGTNAGLLITDTSFKVIRYLNKNNGLVSNNVLSLEYDHSNAKLWIGTEDGISILESNSLQRLNIPPPILNMKSAMIDSIVVSLKQLAQIEIKGQILQLFLSAISYTESASIQFEYWLDNTQHVFTTNRDIYFSQFGSWYACVEGKMQEFKFQLE
jgi:ligand-binding sensor domain-containing protein